MYALPFPFLNAEIFAIVDVHCNPVMLPKVSCLSFKTTSLNNVSGLESKNAFKG